MELNNLGADDKLQKYEEFNALPEVNLGGIEYISNKLPEMNETVDYSSLLSTNKSPLLSPSKPIRVKQPDTEIELADNPNFVAARPDGLDPEVPKVHPINSYEALGGAYKRNDFNLTDLKRQIAKVESDGLGGYAAQNPTSSAVGKYQFVWSIWGDAITKYTGVKTPAEFKKNPEAQEKFFDYYQKTTLEPQLRIIRKEFPDSSYSDSEIMKLLHFRGLGKKDKSDKGLRALLSNKSLLGAKLENNNLTASTYLERSK